jgi:hypothetical protein
MHSGHRREFVKSTGLGTTGAALWLNLRRFTTTEMTLPNNSVQNPYFRFGMVTRTISGG